MKSCKECRWYEDFTGVCFNGDSEYRADFVREDFSCECFEKNFVAEVLKETNVTPPYENMYRKFIKSY